MAKSDWGLRPSRGQLDPPFLATYPCGVSFSSCFSNKTTHLDKEDAQANMTMSGLLLGEKVHRFAKMQNKDKFKNISHKVY